MPAIKRNPDIMRMISETLQSRSNRQSRDDSELEDLRTLDEDELKDAGSHP